MDAFTPLRSEVGGLMIYEKPHEFPLQLKLPGDRNFEGMVYMVTVTLLDDSISSGKYSAIRVVMSPGPFDRVSKQADALISEWGFPRKDIDEWCAGVKATPQEHHMNKFSTGLKEGRFGLYLEFLETYDDEEPWVLAVSISWKREEGD